MDPPRKHQTGESKFDHVVKQKRIDERKRQLKEAVKYCRENNCKGFAAIGRAYAQIWRIQEQSIEDWEENYEKDHCKVMTNNMLVQFIKNRHFNQAREKI